MLTRRQFGEVARFADAMGTDAVEAADGSVNFAFERLGTLSIQASADGDRVVVSLSRLPDRPDAAAELALLRLSGIERTDGQLFHGARCRDGSLLVAVELPAADLSVAAIDAALGRLSERLGRAFGR